MRNSRNIRRQSQECQFFFVKPNGRSNADDTARRILGLKDIEEVLVTDGEYGFIVKARLGKENVQVRVSRVTGLNVAKAKSYYKYIK